MSRRQANVRKLDDACVESMEGVELEEADDVAATQRGDLQKNIHPCLPYKSQSG